MRPAAIQRKTRKIVTRRPWRTGDRTANSILLRDFRTYFIMIYYASLLSQDMSYEIGDWCLAMLKQLNDPMYLEEQRLKAEEEKMLEREAEKRRHKTTETWKHYKARQKEANRRAREADARGTTSETWPLLRSAPGIFAPSSKIL
jgi:hypothetical protein